MLPIIFPPLYINSKNHWNRQIHGLVLNAMKLFQQIAPDEVARLTDEFRAKRQECVLASSASDVHRDHAKLRNREAAWEELRATALRNSANTTGPLPATLLSPPMPRAPSPIVDSPPLSAADLTNGFDGGDISGASFDREDIQAADESSKDAADLSSSRVSDEGEDQLTGGLVRHSGFMQD